jgi:hypothetical protein
MPTQGRSRYCRFICALLLWGAPILIAALISNSRPAQAIPSFARQTGQPCGTCHTDFPALTPYGRLFKLNGYTIGGSRFRTTLVPSSEEERVKPWWPPISTMAIVGFTHTQAPLPPPTQPWSPNNNTSVDPFSFFWGGAVTEHIGAFVQVTHVMPPPGGFASPPAGDPFGHSWGWDNTDVRFANTTKIGTLDVLYGITANNNPTVQDVWNTTPAWGFPFAASTLAPTPSAGTVIDGAFAAHVVSAGGYLWINNMFYVEGSTYHTLNFSTLNHLGADPFDAPGRFDAEPYWRVAFEPHWGSNWLMIGTFGIVAPVHPWVDTSGLLGGLTFPQTDKFTDVGFDAQYQYQGDNYWITLRAAYIREHQRLDATFTNGGAQNPTNELNTLRLTGSLAYGNDNRVVLTGQYFNTWGTRDNLLFAGLAGCPVPATSTTGAGLGPCVPDSNGFIAEIAYIPFGSSPSPLWPWFNARIGLQYTWYNKFDGTSAGASANNTLFLHAWFAM